MTVNAQPKRILIAIVLDVLVIGVALFAIGFLGGLTDPVGFLVIVALATLLSLRAARVVVFT